MTCLDQSHTNIYSHKYLMDYNVRYCIQKFVNSLPVIKDFRYLIHELIYKGKSIYLFIYRYLLIYYRLTPLEYNQVINYIKINGNYIRKIVKETTKRADAPYKGCPL